MIAKDGAERSVEQMRGSVICFDRRMPPGIHSGVDRGAEMQGSLHQVPDVQDPRAGPRRVLDAEGQPARRIAFGLGDEFSRIANLPALLGVEGGPIEYHGNPFTGRRVFDEVFAVPDAANMADAQRTLVLR